MPLSTKQRASITEANGVVNVWEGSIRAGKTIGSLLRWLMFVNTAPSGALVMVGRTRESIGRNALAPLQDPELFGEWAKHVSYTPGAGTAKILGRTVYVLGANDSQASKKIQGLTVAGSYVDEVTTLQEEFFTQLRGRHSVKGAQMFATTNPDNPAHWFKKKFLDRMGDGPKDIRRWRRWHFVMDDNPSLDPDYVAQMKAEYTGLWRRRFIDGEWVSAEGAIFDMWDEPHHVIPWAELPRIHRMLGVGLDYGTTNPTAALILGMTADGRLFLVDEWRHDPSVDGGRWSDAQLSAGFRAWVGRRHVPQDLEPRLERTFIDPAAASLKVQLYADNYEGLADADNNVAYGIRTMASLFASDRLRVSDRCPGFINEAPGYSWDDKKTLKGIDAPIKVADHSVDAARYVITSTEPIWRDAAVDRVAIAALRHRMQDRDAGPRELDIMHAPM